MADKQITIGISGVEGSFSEEAAEEYCRKHNISPYSFSYLVRVENVLSELSKGTIDLGIFPIENSNGGIVYEAVHAMAAHTFYIKEIFEIDVQHCLLVKSDVKTSDIEIITSHDQAIKQCRMYLRRNWPSIQPQEHKDTALAAKELHEGTLPSTTAVIAPGKCASLYQLEIFESGIQDLKFNFTTFIAATNGRKESKEV